jgi:hypothetical protein
LSLSNISYVMLITTAIACNDRETADLAARLGPEDEHWAEAQALGANEVLVHLLAMTSDERRAVTAHLRRRHVTPLNGRSPVLAAG